MSHICCAPDATPATRVPANHPSRYLCLLSAAKDASREALADLAATDLSADGELRSRPDYWVGQLQYLLGYLLTVIDETGS